MTQPTTSSPFWDERYQDSKYLYGERPNDFLHENSALFKRGDSILSIAEGEGRNAVFLAECGYKVRGVDFSQTGHDKALQLAKKRGVTLDYDIANLEDYSMGENHWHGIVSIFCHLPAALRPAMYKRIQLALKPGGMFLMESYNQQQLVYKSGGPKDVSLLISLEELTQAFMGYELLLARDIKREVQEGAGHTGLSSTTQFIARKTP